MNNVFIAIELTFKYFLYLEHQKLYTASVYPHLHSKKGKTIRQDWRTNIYTCASVCLMPLSLMILVVLLAAAVIIITVIIVVAVDGSYRGE